MDTLRCLRLHGASTAGWNTRRGMGEERHFITAAWLWAILTLRSHVSQQPAWFLLLRCSIVQEKCKPSLLVAVIRCTVICFGFWVLRFIIYFDEYWRNHLHQLMAYLYKWCCEIEGQVYSLCLFCIFILICICLLYQWLPFNQNLKNPCLLIA